MAHTWPEYVVDGPPGSTGPTGKADFLAVSPVPEMAQRTASQGKERHR